MDMGSKWTGLGMVAVALAIAVAYGVGRTQAQGVAAAQPNVCLLYTSDAADE